MTLLSIIQDVANPKFHQTPEQEQARTHHQTPASIPIPRCAHPLGAKTLRSSSNSTSCSYCRLRQILRRLGGMHTHPLLAQEIDKQRVRLIGTRAGWVHSLVLLVALYVLDVHVEEVG